MECQCRALTTAISRFPSMKGHGLQNVAAGVLAMFRLGHHLLETQILILLGRLDMKCDFRRVLEHLDDWPVGLHMANASTRLVYRGFPADEFITATSLTQDVQLLIRNRTIVHSRIVLRSFST